MLPSPYPSDPTIWNPYIPPDDKESYPLDDWQLGGVGLSDPTQGLEYQFWRLQVVVDEAFVGYFWVSAPNTAPVLLFSRPGATWGRLAFDQNMHPTIAFSDNAGACLYWFDPVSGTNTFYYFDVTGTVKQPCITLDDKRSISTQRGTSDVILTYVKAGDLCYRVQRERFATEHTYVVNVDQLIPNAQSWKVGMNDSYRLQFLLHGNLYQ